MSLFRRIGSLGFGSKDEWEIVDELDGHIQMRTADHIAAEMPPRGAASPARGVDRPNPGAAQRMTIKNGAMSVLYRPATHLVLETTLKRRQLDRRSPGQARTPAAWRSIRLVRPRHS
jgi:hypothetical protein